MPFFLIYAEVQFIQILEKSLKIYYGLKGCVLSLISSVYFALRVFYPFFDKQNILLTSSLNNPSYRANATIFQNVKCLPSYIRRASRAYIYIVLNGGSKPILDL